MRVDEGEKEHLKEKKGYQSAWGVLLYSCTSWLESYVKIVWHTSVPHDCWTWRQHKLAASFYTLIVGRMAVEEGAIIVLGIRARRTQKTELSRTVFLYIHNCLQSAAVNAGKHCPSTFNWKGRIRGLTLDPPGKSWLSKQTLTIFSVTSKRKECNLKIFDFVVLHTYPNAFISLVIFFCFPPFPCLPWKGEKKYKCKVCIWNYLIRKCSKMLKDASYFSWHSAQKWFFFQFAKDAKEYLEVNEDILTTTEGYGA